MLEVVDSRHMRRPWLQTGCRSSFCPQVTHTPCVRSSFSTEGATSLSVSEHCSSAKWTGMSLWTSPSNNAMRTGHAHSLSNELLAHSVDDDESTGLWHCALLRETQVVFAKPSPGCQPRVPAFCQLRGPFTFRGLLESGWRLHIR